MKVRPAIGARISQRGARLDTGWTSMLSYRYFSYADSAVRCGASCSVSGAMLSRKRRACSPSAG